MSNSLDKDQEKFEQRQDYYITAGNETSHALNKQLIFFATTVLSLSLFIFGHPEVLGRLEYIDRWLMILAWISLAFSAIFGGLQFFIVIGFFKKWSRAMSLSIDEVCQVKKNKKRLNGLDMRIRMHQEKTAFLETSDAPLYTQIFFIILAFILLLSVMTKILLDFNFLIVLWKIVLKCMFY